VSVTVKDLSIVFGGGSGTFSGGGGGGAGLVASGLLLEYLFNEGSGTVVHDSSGNGFDANFGSAGAGGTYPPAWNSKGVAFSVPSQLLLPLSSALWNNVLSVMIFADCNPGSGLQNLLSFDSLSYDGPQLNLREGTGQLEFQTNTQLNNLVYESNFVLRGPQAITATLGNPRKVYWGANDVTAQAVEPGNAYLSGAYTPYVPTTQAWIGDFYLPGYAGLVGNVYYVLFYSTVLTPAQIAQNIAYVQSVLTPRGVTLGDTSTNKGSVLFVGDSITAGYGPSTWPGEYPTQTMALLSGSYNWQNFGIGGWTLAAWLAMESELYPVVNQYSNPPKILVFWAGRNDIAINADTAAGLYAKMVSFCNAQKAANPSLKIIFLDNLPGGDITGALETIRTTLNGLYTADFTQSHGHNVYSSATVTYADYLIDVAAEVNLQTPSNGTYYADTVHPTTAGAAIIAADVKVALNLCGVS
jgi:lysophospholipase L1-like esterase